MLKRVLACFCSFLIVVSFCCQCFVVSAATEGSSGGGGHRGNVIQLDRSEPDTSVKVSSRFKIDWGDEDSRNNLFNYCLGLAGAVFSDDTTVKSVYNQFRVIYGSDDPETLEKIFYVGKDGQLYFTDDFLSQFRAIVDENSFNQGVFSIPFSTSDKLFQKGYSAGCLALSNSLTSCLSGEDMRFMNGCYSSAYKYFNTGFSFSDYSVVIPFRDFSAYRSFCTASYSSSVSCFFYSNGSMLSLPEDVDPWYLQPNSSTGTFNTSHYSPFYFKKGQSSFSVSSYYSDLDSSDPTFKCFFCGLGTFEAYRSPEHYQFYTSGGTGVIRGNTYYALDNKQDADNIFGKDWKTYYQGLQKQYKELAGEVAAGNKTLKEINQTLSDQILDTVADISQDVAQQTNYLKKILEEIRNISGKLTYSNVVGTVSAASNLLSAICDGLDSLFGGEDSGVFSLLDFVENHVLNESGQTAASIMKSVFPFSLPQDFYLILELLSVDPQTPQVHFKFELKRLNMSYDYTYVADDFAKLAYMTRFFSSVGFVLLLINFTNKILKK